jgi:tetratricopeptide (TPR) repeat protein
MNTLADICITYDIAAMSQYKVYEKELVSIFKNGDYLADVDESSSCSDSILYHFCGLYHYHSLGNIDRAKEYFTLSADLGWDYSMHYIGDIYERIGNYNKAIEYYILAADAGWSESYNNIGAIYEMQHKDFDNAKLYYHKTLDEDVQDAVCIYNLANIYDAVDGDFDTAKIYYKHALELGYWDAAICLANIYDQYDDDIDEAVKYYLIAIEHGDEESFIHLINLIVDVGHEFTNYEITAVIQFAKEHPEPVRELYNEHKIVSNDLLPLSFSRAWHDILVNLGLEKPDLAAMNYLALKRKTHGKLAVCDVCMSDGEIECIPVNWCMHYVCISCYLMVYNKACPFCRLDSPS